MMCDLEKLKKVARRSYEKIHDSAVFLGIFSGDYTRDPVCLIQFTLAVLMDKPLYLLIPKGHKPSKKLIRLLDGYEFYTNGDEESFEKAAEKLFEKIKRKAVSK
jgi:hypothetical protein